MNIPDINNIYQNPLFSENINYQNNPESINQEDFLNNSLDRNIIKYINLIENNSSNPIDFNIENIYQNIQKDELKINKISENLNDFENYLNYFINLIKYYNELTIKQENIIKKVPNSKYIDSMKYQYFKNLTIFKKLINSIKKIIPKNIPNCEICISNVKSVVFVPCGHSLCDTCFNDYIKKYNYKKCHICRELISKYFKLF